MRQESQEGAADAAGAVSGSQVLRAGDGSQVLGRATEELITNLHADLRDTAPPYNDERHRALGTIMTLRAALLQIGAHT